jgi:hypothetical protein
MASRTSSLHGLIAEFDDPTSLVAATERAHAEGYRAMDAYSPFPIEELHHALGSHHTRLPLIVLIGGMIGCGGGYGCSTGIGCAYPLYVAGKPLHSWPAFIPGRVHDSGRRSRRARMLALNGLRAYRRLQRPAVRGAVRNRFFLCIRASDRSSTSLRAFSSLSPQEVAALPTDELDVNAEFAKPQTEMFCVFCGLYVDRCTRDRLGKRGLSSRYARPAEVPAAARIDVLRR